MRIAWAGIAAGVLGAGLAAAQEPPHDMSSMAAMEATAPADHWETMAHGYAFVNGNRQGGPSGGRELESQNHFMLVASRAWAGGKLSLMGTFTLEPATIPARGSRELFQRGETYHNVLLVDRQHPHDLFVQLAAAWEKPLGAAGKIRLYAAPIGEPALGPEAFPHRLSASENPTAPLSHHNQDSTHIAADVVSVSWSPSIFTLEASAFHGREPDENRWDLEQGSIDSYSGRLWIRPTPELSVQVSSGRLEHPEKLESGSQTRTTGSVQYQVSTAGGFLAAMIGAGKNQTSAGPEWGNLFELTWKFGEKNFLYGRAESVDRDLYELRNKVQRPDGIPPQRTSVQSATLGFVRDFDWIPGLETGLGADASVYRFSSKLDSVYGAHPVSVHGFLRLRFESHGEQQGGHDHGKM
jgi:hypothetical protein